MIIGVFGAGLLGVKLTQIAAVHGNEVYLYDSFPQKLKMAEEKIFHIPHQKSGTSLPDNLRVVYDLTLFGRCDIIFETVIEDIEVKKDVLMRLEAIAKRDCILCTCSESLTLSKIAGVVRKKRRFLKVNFTQRSEDIITFKISTIPATSPEVSKHLKDILRSWNLKPE